jgi:hypothetical protein
MSYDQIKAQIEDGIEGTRLAQIELCRLLHRFPNDARVRAKLAEVKSIASDWRQIERDFRAEYGDEDDPPRAFSVWS